MTSSPVSIMLNTSLQLMGLTTNMSTPTNQSDDSPSGAMNWSVPEGCTMVMLSQMKFSPWNHPDAIVSAEERLLVQKIRQYMQVLLFLIGGPANVINMAVFYRQGLKDRVTLCLFFLALTDELHVTVLTAFQAEEIYNLFHSEEGIGPHLTFVINSNLLVIIGIYYVSPILSAIIAVERCLCVLNPLTFKELLRTRTMAVIIFLAYVSAYALSFSLFIRFHIGCLYDPTFDVRIMAPLESEFFKANKEFVSIMESIVVDVGIHGGTVIVVTIVTIQTIIKLREMKKWRSKASASFSSREVGLTKMLVGSSVLLTVCMLPSTLFNVVRLFFPEVDYGKRDQNLYLCCAWIKHALVLIKPTLNFFVYYAMGSRYRETFWGIFGRRKKKVTQQLS